MKIKRITALALVCLLLTTSSCRKRKPGSEAVTPTEFAAVSSEEASSEYVQWHWFEPADCRVREVAPGMTVDEVKEILGNPELAYNVDADEMEEAYIGTEYPGMTLSFDKEPDKKFRLSCIYIRDESITLPNGLHVGNTLYEVVNAFDNPQNITFTEDREFFDNTLYVYNSHSRFIPGIFNQEWPDEPVQAGYCSDYRKGMAPLMYIYCDSPVWNGDRTAYNFTTYTIYFKTEPGKVTINQIDIVKRTELISKGE